MNPFKDQRGIAQLILLGLVALVLAVVGAAIYNVTHSKQANATPTPTISSSSNPIPSASPTAQSDNDLITAAVKAYDSQSTNDMVSSITIVSANAKGTGASNGTASGYEFIAHKDNGKWSVVYKGQEIPGKALGEKYGLPTTWYSTAY